MSVKPHYRPERKKPFEARWYVEGKQKSKFFETEKERDAWIPKQEGALARHGTRGIEASPAAIERWKKAQSIIGPDVDPVAVANFWVKNHSEKPAPLFNIAAADYLDQQDIEFPGGERSKRCRLHLGRFASVAQNRSINRIPKSEIYEWVRSIPGSANTKKNHLATISAFFQHYKQLDIIEANPCHGIRRPTAANVEPGTIDPDTLKEILIANFDNAAFCGLLAINVFGCMRSSAVSRVEYSDIDFEQRGIRTPANKTKKERRLFLQGHPEVMWLWLERTPKSAFAKPIPDVDPNSRMGKKDLIQWKQQCKRRWEAMRERALKRSGHLMTLSEVILKNHELAEKGLPLLEEKPIALPDNWGRHSALTYHLQKYKNPGLSATLASHRKDPAILYTNYIGERSDAEADAWYSWTPEKIADEIALRNGQV